MSSVRSKSYGQGPYGYFQRVLSDGARPFQYQSQASQLLGKQRESAVRPIGANRVASLNFHFPDLTVPRDRFSGKSNIEQSMGSTGTLEPTLNSIESGQGFSEAQLEGRKVDGSDFHAETQAPPIQKISEDMTVLAWLEKMQVQQPLPVEDEPNENDFGQVFKAKGVNQTPFGDQKMPVSEQSGPKDSNVQEGETTPLSFQAPALNSESFQIEADMGTGQLFPKDWKKSDFREQKKKDANVSSAGMNIPDGTRPRENRLVGIDDTLISPIPTDRKKRIQIQQENIKSHPEKNIPSIVQRPGLAAKKSNEASKDNRSQSSDSFPSAKLNIASQRMNISRLQQALGTRPITGMSLTKEASSNQAKLDIGTNKGQQPPAQMRQHVTIVNLPARDNFTSAFWERSYMNRFGPRSYK